MESTETTLAASVLAHLLHANSLDPSYAGKSARHFAKLDPYQLSDMPELLEKALLPKPPSSP